jgi:hypothetical protein
MNFLAQLKQAMAAVVGKDKKASDISEEEKIKVAEKYKELFNAELDKDFEAYQEIRNKATAYDSAISMIADEGNADTKGGKADPKGNAGPEGGKAESKGNAGPEAGKAETKGNAGPEGGKADPKGNAGPEGGQEQAQKPDLTASINNLQQKNKELEQQVNTLSQSLEGDDPKIKKMKIGIIGNDHTENHLFGIESDFYSLNKRWNKIMANPAYAKIIPSNKGDFENLQKETENYGHKVAARMQALHAKGLLSKENVKKLAAGELDVTRSDLSDAGLGDQFMVRRMDALVARIQMLPNVYDIFPRRFGVQDRELMTNAFLGEFSQAYQKGQIWKGTAELQPEMGYVDDAMMKTLFESMKWIERTYIGYLNTEGSDDVKWTMIEWLVLQIASKLMNEQYKRRIKGVFVEPVDDDAGHYLHASTGYEYTILRYIHENKLNPFADAGLSDYDDSSTNMVDAVLAFKEKLHEEVEDFDESQFALYLNKNHNHWYKDQYRSKYATNMDFKSIDDTMVPDSDMKIIWVPNMGQSKLMVCAKPGNLQCLEYLPGEMLNIKFQQDMENVKSWSIWKEGFTAAYVGKKFDSISNLVANSYKLQEVFCNKPVTALEDGDTTADGSSEHWFKTIENTGATAFTDFTSAREGVGYILECGHTTNATTVAKSAKFSEITAAYTPTAVGDYLMVVWDAGNSKFYELERKVGGTRTINSTKQPNMPGNGGR